MSFIGNQKDARLQAISDKANGAVHVGFPTINVAGTDIVATSNTDTLYVSGDGVTVTTNTNQRTLSIATTSDLRVSQNSAMSATNNWTTVLDTNSTVAGWDAITWST